MTSVADPPETPRDPLLKIRAYVVAVEAVESVQKVALLLESKSYLHKSLDQLIYAVGSIKANIVEGYRRSTGHDRARFFEYSLASTSESQEWYRTLGPFLPEGFAEREVTRLEEAIRLLVVMTRRQRSLGSKRLL